MTRREALIAGGAVGAGALWWAVAGRSGQAASDDMDLVCHDHCRYGVSVEKARGEIT